MAYLFSFSIFAVFTLALIMRPFYMVQESCLSFGFYATHLTFKSFLLLASTDRRVCNSVFVWTPLGWLQVVPTLVCQRYPKSCDCRSRVVSFVGDQKCCLILASLISYHEWKIHSHAVNVQNGILGITSLPSEGGCATDF